MKYRSLPGRTEAAGGRGVAGGNKSPECGEAASPIDSEGPLVLKWMSASSIDELVSVRGPLG